MGRGMPVVTSLVKDATFGTNKISSARNKAETRVHR